MIRKLTNIFCPPQGHRLQEYTSRTGCSAALRKRRVSCGGAEIQTGKYRLLKTLHKGSCAKDKLARHVTTSAEAAMRITPMSTLGLQKLHRQVKTMKTLIHPNTVQLSEIINTEKTFYLVAEYAKGGKMYDYWVTQGKMEEKKQELTSDRPCLQ